MHLTCNSASPAVCLERPLTTKYKAKVKVGLSKVKAKVKASPNKVKAGANIAGCSSTFQTKMILLMSASCHLISVLKCYKVGLLCSSR